MMGVEEFNTKEEIKEIVEKCIKCGLCNSHCPVLRIVREEQVSPRGRSIILGDEIIEKSVYACTLCGACETKCPLNLKLCDAFLKARQVLVFQKKELLGNKNMIENLKKKGNSLGVKEDI
jgi:glycolate oxidase iron-sulfur subunit